MRRVAAALIGLVAPGALLIVACGGGSAEHAAVCDMRTAILPSASAPYEQVTLERARELLGFDVLLPQELPPGVQAFPPLIHRSVLCPSVIIDVELTFRGADFRLKLTERRSTAPADASGATPVRVNGFDGQRRVVGGSGSEVLDITWRQHSVEIEASVPLHGGVTEEQLLEILNSMPD